MQTKQTIIIKIGSSVFVNERRRLDLFRLQHIFEQIKRLQGQGISLVMIISGAVAVGSRSMQQGEISDLARAYAAGIGQAEITGKLYKIAQSKDLKIAQILLTKEIFKSTLRKEKLIKILGWYMNNEILPVINENDVIDLNSFGGNDILAFKIAQLIHADRYFILSSWKSHFGFGGGESKRKIIKEARRSGIVAQILDGRNRDCIINSIF